MATMSDSKINKTSSKIDKLHNDNQIVLGNIYKELESILVDVRLGKSGWHVRRKLTQLQQKMQEVLEVAPV